MKKLKNNQEKPAPDRQPKINKETDNEEISDADDSTNDDPVGRQGIRRTQGLRRPKKHLVIRRDSRGHTQAHTGTIESSPLPVVLMSK
jgi:hypothetical protein